MARLRRKRQKERWSVRKLCAESGITSSTYYRWKGGEPILAKTALRVCDNLKVKAPNYLLVAESRREALSNLVDRVRPKDYAGRCLATGKVGTYLQAAALAKGVRPVLISAPTEPPAARLEVVNPCGRFVVDLETSDRGICYYRLKIGARDMETTVAIGRASQLGTAFCLEFLCKTQDILEGHTPKSLKESHQLKDLY